MRDLIVTENITPDGVIEATDRLIDCRQFRSGIVLLRHRVG